VTSVARRSMRKAGRWLRAVFVTSALAVLALPQAAGAHPVVEWGNPPGSFKAAPLTGYQGFCVNAQVTQEHAWHHNTTSSTNCNNYTNRWLHQYEQFYKMRLLSNTAEYCFDNGWHQSPNGSSSSYFNFWGWDAGHWCNYGGAHMKLFIDTWQGAWNGAQWIDGFRRPATAHCHCP
jgi:hypothetical protein